MGTTISFGLFDVAIKRNSHPEAADKQYFIDTNDLRLEGVTPRQAATLEGDYWRLDGSYSTFPDEPAISSWGWWSRSMSDADGIFRQPITMIFVFEQTINSAGVSFEFNPYGNNYCNHLSIGWYQDDTLLHQEDFYPTGWRYSCMQEIAAYNKLVLTFYSTDKPYRYLKLQKINFGIYRAFDESEITAATMLEEIDPISAELSINTLDFNLYSENREFNILNPQGIYKQLQQKQSLRVITSKEGIDKEMGTYYLDTWENEGEYSFIMTAIDAVGLMENTTFKGGMYTSYPVVDLLTEIITDAGFGFNIDESFDGLTVSGWLPICSHRAALQQVAFMIGAVVDDSRGDAIKVYPINNNIASVITRENKFEGGKVKLRQLVTGIEMAVHTYTLSTELSELYKGILQKGTNEITFSQPASNITATVGIITESGVNYVRIMMEQEGEVIINGNQYIDTTQLVAKYMADLPEGEKQNILKISDVTLTSGNPADVVNQVYSYYQRRIEQEFDFPLMEQKVGQTVEIETLYDEMRAGAIEKLETDLVGGMVAKVVAVGD